MYAGTIVLDLKKDYSNIAYLIFQELLEQGLKEDLKKRIDINMPDGDKSKYSTVSKINNERMTWKTLVNLLHTIYNVSDIKITCKIEYGTKRRVIIEEEASITLD